MFTIDYEKLHRLERAFLIYEIATHGVDPRKTLEGTTFRIKNREGYKQGAFDELHGMVVKGGPYTNILLKGFDISNLASYRQRPNIEKIAASEDAELLEAALSSLYEGDDDEAAFNDLVGILGGNFDVLGLIFFIKDCEKYLPIRSDTFDERFQQIGCDSKLSHNCTWDKYQEYNETIRDIHKDLKKNVNSDITIIDAHSFVWVLKGVTEYSNNVKQPVEHSNNNQSFRSNKESEKSRIKIQIEDLRSVQKSLEEESATLNREKKRILLRRSELDILIRGELRPQVEQLKDSLEELKTGIRYHKTQELIDRFSNVLLSELEVTNQEEADDIQFKAKNKFLEVFQAPLNTELSKLMKICNYPNLAGVRFDDDEMDVVVNGNIKKTQGQGYRAYLNAIMAIALQNVLDGFDKYKPGMLVIDSPLQSLYEKKHSDIKKLTETMKAGLFKYLVDNQSNRQTIIIENEIPDIDYEGANLIEFTKDGNDGRYGLIEGYTE